MKRLLVLFRTVRHLRPIQIVHRIRLRSRRALIGAFPTPAEKLLCRQVPASAGWPAGFRPILSQQTGGFPSPEANAEGTFKFLNREIALGWPPDWHPSEASRLWLFHLHYFDWAISFANHSDRNWARSRFSGLWRSWKETTTLGRRDDWSPYVASCRIWNLCGAFADLVKGADIEGQFVKALALDAGFVRANLELDVGGNHLIKNIKALVGAGVFLADESLLNKGIQLLKKALPVQILEDGGHYELSPSYHCQVLEDLIDIEELLTAAQLPELVDLRPTILRMREWLGAMQMPDGDVPLLNDSWPMGAERVNRLRPIRDDKRLTVLGASGYVVVRPRPETQLVLDVGPPGPASLPAHSHADALSFVLSVDGKRVIVDTGVSTYGRDKVRQYQRSTAAHSTVEIDGEDQSEVWSSFRIARRARVSLLEAEDRGDTIIVTGSHDGYRRLRGKPVHSRTWLVTVEGVTVVDSVTGHGTHRISRRLIFAPDAGLAPAAGDTWITECGVLVTDPEAEELWTCNPVDVAIGFGRVVQTDCLSSTVLHALPVELSLTIRYSSEVPRN